MREANAPPAQFRPGVWVQFCDVHYNEFIGGRLMPDRIGPSSIAEGPPPD